MHEFLEHCGGFMGAGSDYQAARLVLVGAPMDFTVSFRPGTRSGPQRIREVSVGLEEYSPYQQLDLKDYCYYDAGDVVLPFGHVPQSLNRLEDVVGKLLADDKFPLVLGGEHLITLAPVKQTAQRFPGLAVLHFDAHADLRVDYLGESLSHATVMRRVAEVVGSRNLFQFGIRSGTADEFAYGYENTGFYPFEILNPLRQTMERLRGRPIYVTLDIDVVDPAFAPGTGTPEPGGCSSVEIMAALHMLKGLNVVGMDLVEVCPVYDQSDRTALLAAKLVREAILLFGS
ncbi:agmatinase [Desulfoscipio gibsoniae]|uniref:Agmatinase n=1 Tax=Desulfoscipio gibsoniae DSM 7213 TaxID=767817 RepID=R4KRM5_9FIRM|nr:agmatinase [Desulfoscipio gibsoniae]AGL03230.1 agmatinase [Desulfoscipio gibsoniae DSM 7213]